MVPVLHLDYRPVLQDDFAEAAVLSITDFLGAALLSPSSATNASSRYLFAAMVYFAISFSTEAGTPAGPPYPPGWTPSGNPPSKVRRHAILSEKSAPCPDHV